MNILLHLSYEVAHLAILVCNIIIKGNVSFSSVVDCFQIPIESRGSEVSEKKVYVFLEDDQKFITWNGLSDLFQYWNRNNNNNEKEWKKMLENACILAQIGLVGFPNFVASFQLLRTYSFKTYFALKRQKRRLISLFLLID